MMLQKRNMPAPLELRHKELELQFERVIEAARSGDWRECDKIWEQFERDLIAHMSFEERILFPAYARTSERAAVNTKKLIAEHSTLTEQLEELGDALQLHHSAIGVEAFIATLRAHAHSEDEMFHPWVAESWNI
jgi:iron-sulfur cluster repair protein YtfE (RIC family)